MEMEPLSIAGAWVMTPRIHGDARGQFLEWFRAPAFREAVGHDFTLAQANCSVSGAGIVRGIHFADVPPGQAKYVSCVAGRVLDVVVDIRVGSPTFGRWEGVELDARSRRAVYLAEGLGHGFASLVDGSTVVYLCSQPYQPAAEHEINPVDPVLGIDWRVPEPILSAKDEQAPGLDDARARGLLPDHASCVRFTDSL